MKRIFRLITHAGSHEYDIIVTEFDKGVIFALHYSANEAWTRPGTKIFEIKEDEFDGTIKLPKLNRTVDLCAAIDLGKLLRFMSLYKAGKHIDDCKYIAVESTTGINI